MSPVHIITIELTIGPIVITSTTDDITTDFRLRPLMAHFLKVLERAMIGSRLEVIAGRCLHCFLSSCDSAAESSKWL